MQIFHKKSADLSQKEWDQISSLNQKIIRTSLYDQRFFDGGCLATTCEGAITKAMKAGTAEVLLGFEESILISYMIFYCIDNPSSVQIRLDAYNHLGRVGYSDMLVVAPNHQQKGYSKLMRARMKQIAREAKVDVFMTFVRGLPIPNIPSLMSLRSAGAVCGRNLLILERKFEDTNDTFTDMCLEMIYPSDNRILTTNTVGKVVWKDED